MDNEYKKLISFAGIVALFGYGFLAFLAVIDVVIRAMLIFTAIGLLALGLYGWHLIKGIQKEKKRNWDIFNEKVEPFIISEYLDRIEKANIEMLENREPVGQTIILWVGLDGLKINDDGSSEWISRKKPETVKQNVSLQPPQALAQVSRPFDYSMCQCTQAQINELQAQNTALQMQAAQSAQNTAIMAALQRFVVPNPEYMGCATYPPYFYGGIGGCYGRHAGAAYYWQ